MANEYNSKLISDLYKAESSRKAVLILEEMDEIQDPVFIYPLYEVYKKFKNKSISHYFLSSLSLYQSPEVLELFLEVSEDSSVSVTDFTYAISYFTKVNHTEDTITRKAIILLFKELEEGARVYNIRDYIEYLQSANEIDSVKDELYETLLRKETPRDSIRYILKKLLQHNSKETFEFLVKNFSKVSSQRTQAALTEVIKTWSGGNADKLKKLIAEKGNKRSIEILEEYEKSQTREKEEAKKKEIDKLPNTDIVFEIASKRKKINSICKASEKIQINIFTESEEIFNQLSIAQNESDLIHLLVNFRSFVQKLNTDELKKHGYSTEEAMKMIPGSNEQTVNKSINSLYLFLTSRDVECDETIFGLRTINKILSKSAHSDSKKEFLSLLKEAEIYHYYKNEEWEKLHREILCLYNNFLSELESALDV